MSVIDAAFSGAVTAGVADAALRPQDYGRTEIIVVNTHATQGAYLQLPDQQGIAKAAVVGEGIYLSPAGGSWSSTTWKGAVRCIATGATTVLTVVDY